MRSRLIIVSPKQYGYQTDYLKYVQYLSKIYRVIFICIDQGEKKFECNNADVKYISCGGKQLSYMAFMIYTYFYILLHSGKIMTTNFGGCRYLKRFLPWRKMVVNIRTVSVDKDPINALAQNKRIKRDALPFDRIIMISEGGAKQLHLPMEKVDIVGLGADPICTEKKNYNPLKLLYVGTLNNRDIIKTVQGFNSYIKATGDKNITYDIVGDGDEYEEISDYITKHHLSAQVKMHGWIHFSHIKPFFEKCNIGVSFVPINDSYKFQPPTKTYEYINSGLYVIATNNPVHQDFITDKCGTLIQDTAPDFERALTQLSKKQIDESDVRDCGQPYLWKFIINNQLLKSLEKI